LIAWLSAAAGLILIAPPSDPTLGEATDLLPPDTPVHTALAELAGHFGSKSGLSDAVVVFERSSGPLTPDDLQAVQKIAQLIAAPPTSADEPIYRDISVRTPADLALAGKNNPMISADGQAALISAGLKYNFISKQAARIVEHAQQVVADYPLPGGLSASVTGSAGYGYDYSLAIERSHRKTLVVTLISVIVILLAVYRAPVAALVPLVGIGIASLVVVKLLAIGDRFGLHNGTAEQIFTFVLLYGAGIDYSMLFISRYREFLESGSASAIGNALDASIGSIVSSATVTVCGLAMLCTAKFSVFRQAGPAVVLAVIVAATAAATLVPAMLAIKGKWAFWPGGPRNRPIPAFRANLWPAVAKFVSSRPLLVMGATLAALCLPAIRGSRVNWTYDALLSIKPSYPARHGTEMVQRHWPTGEIAPMTILLVADQPVPKQNWQTASEKLSQTIGALPDVDDIRALSSPLGKRVPQIQSAGIELVAAQKIEQEYLSPDGKAMRLTVVLKTPPLSLDALQDAADIRTAAQNAVAAANLPAQIYLAGQTAEMVDMRRVTHLDFNRVAASSLILILMMMTIALRDLPVSMFIVAATLLSYFTTLGLVYWIVMALGAAGLEWKMQMLLFIVLVAVGQDYSIFYAVRYEQEARQHPRLQAAQRALVFTGPVISSCGLIMAATLGSIMASDVTLLVQLGFAFSLGMLIDTFIIRPLLLPAFIVMTGSRRGNSVNRSRDRAGQRA
jgi:putative drug exporter of the RND superfamily